MAKKPYTAKLLEIRKQQKAHEATLAKISQLQEQADREASELNRLNAELNELRKAEQEQKLKSIAFGQSYDGDALEATMDDIAFLLDPKTREAAMAALAAARTKTTMEE